MDSFEDACRDDEFDIALGISQLLLEGFSLIIYKFFLLFAVFVFRSYLSWIILS